MARDFNKTLQIYFGLEGINHGNRQAQEKFELDEATENTPVMSTKANRATTDRATRRKAEFKARRHLRKVGLYAPNVRFTRNGGVINKGNLYSWHPTWKKLDHHLSRNEGKKEIADFFADDSQPFDAWEDWNGMYFDEHFPTREDGTIDLDAVWREEHPTYEDDEDDDDDGYEYRRYYDPETGDHVVECVETENHKLRREINLYKDFLGEYNLGKLFKTWLAANGKEARYDR